MGGQREKDTSKQIYQQYKKKKKKQMWNETENISEVRIFKVCDLQLAGSVKYSALKALLQMHMKNCPEAHKGAKKTR